MKEQFKFKFSIIMAVYNVEDYLQEAVESVLQQDIGFKDNVQLILVDDGSTDSSGILCDDYAQKYPNNISVIHKENGGVASAKNAGLPYAEGRFLNFMDSDDKITNNVLSEVYKFFMMHENETDIVTIPIDLFGVRTGEHYLNYKFKKGDRIIDLYKEYDAIVRTVASSFFPARCKSDIHFDERLVIGEDTKLILSLIYKKMKIGVISSCRYMYRKRGHGGGSLVESSKFVYGYYFDYFTYLTDWVEDFYKEKLGFVPAYVQYESMIELSWRTKANYDGSPLISDEMEQYKKRLFECYKYIDDEYILKQKIIYKEQKNFILSKKYCTNPQITLCDNDALVHFGDSIICYISNCYVKLEFLEYKDKILYLEGFTKVLGIKNDEKVEVYVLFNGEKIICELTDRENIDNTCFDEVIFKGIGFKCQVSMDRMAKQGEIKFGITFRRVDIIKKDLKLGKFSPIIKNPKNSYYYADNLIITVKNNVLFWRKCTKKDVNKQETLLLSELRDSKEKEVRNAALFRYLYHLLKPLYKKEIWLISDRINKADDSGEALFKYINEKKLPVNAYFILMKDSTYYNSVKKIGKVVTYLSWKHKLLHLLADKIISSAADEHVYNPFQKNERYYRDILVKKQRIFLQHGIIHNDISSWLNKYNKNLAMFVTAAVSEYNSVIKGKYFYDEKVVKLTGLARYDRLEDRKQKIITIMPTWRDYLGNNETYFIDGLKKYNSTFKKSDYFKFYNSLINNKRLIDAAMKYDYKIKFMPHPNIISYIDWFTKNGTVEFCSINTKYRDIFAESSLVMTDYSSVVFDFAYLKKPLIYCQFDKGIVFLKHSIKKGYFDYERDGFGEVEYSLDGTVDRIIKYMKNGCVLKDRYKERIDRFFAFHDRNNCKRIYEAINEIGKN